MNVLTDVKLKRIALAFGLAAACSLPSAWATEYDVVITGGRVMDPGKRV